MDSMWSGVAGVVIGWLLAQASTVLVQLHERRKTKRALLDELGELSESLDHWWMAYSRSLQMISAGRVDNQVPLPLPHFIFTHHYKDAALGMNRDQRRSMQMIHAYVDRLNQSTAEYRVYLQELHAPKVAVMELTDEIERSVRDSVKNLLQVVRMTQWHIWYHFEHPLLPELAPGLPAHKKFVQYLEQVRSEISEIERQGTTVPVKRFDEFYVKEYFDSIPDD